MTEPCDRAPVESQAPEDVLPAVAALLGVNFLKEEKGTLLKSNCSLDWSSIPWEPCNNVEDQDREVADVDFSSFPSLSLDRSPEEQFDSPRGTKSDVEAHVSELLDRPILVSNPNTGVQMAEDDGAETLDFVASKVSEVPGQMLQNFFNSFTTLMNSRLRAYATFLARHGLTLLETSGTSDSEQEEGLVGVEVKLETMLNIGKFASTNAIVTSFHAIKDKAIRKESTDETCAVSMPLVMDAAIDIYLPRPWGGQSELVTVAFQTTGTITGIFSNASGNSLLRVVGVDLDITKLLSCMMEQAASVISCIVEMTNVTFSLSLPSSLDEAQGAALNSAQDGCLGKKRKGRAHLVEPDTVVVLPSQHAIESEITCIRDFNEDQEIDDCVELSAEHCEHLVDFVLYEAPESILSPPSRKKLKVVSTEGAADLPDVS